MVRHADPDRIPWLPLTRADAGRVAAAAGAALRDRPWVKACWLYGSLVRGDRPPRDVDFGVLTGFQRVPLAEWDDARGAIADALGLDPAVVDLRPVDGGSPVFLHEVLTHGLLCCEPDPQARIDFEVRAVSLWCELKPVWEATRAAALERWPRE